MKIRVSEIPEAGLHLTLNINVKTEGLKTAGPVRGTLSVLKSGDEVYVVGNAKLTVLHTCSLCLVEFLKTMDIDIDLTYLAAIEPDGDDIDIVDDIDTCYYQDDEIDVGQVVNEQILLSIPMRVVCTDDCKGLCPKCGANLNEGSCSCGGVVLPEDSFAARETLTGGAAYGTQVEEENGLVKSSDYASILKSKFKVKKRERSS
ncbi:MAG: DUF177 domain-containing protein [Nitrospirae bacterium]|nr:DUF177 domain-containing protein [Nitrospirota bacterium]